MELRVYAKKERSFSWLRLILSWIAAMVIQLPIYMALGVEFVKAPFTAVFLLWIAFSAAVVVAMDELGR